jgi:hypothetical protein
MEIFAVRGVECRRLMKRTELALSEAACTGLE